MLTCRDQECRQPFIWKEKGHKPGCHVQLVDLDWLHHFLRLLSTFLFVTLGDTPGVLFIVTTLNELQVFEHAFFFVVFSINDIFRECKRHGPFQRRKAEVFILLEVENCLSWNCNSGLVFEKGRPCVCMLMKLPIYIAKVSEKYGNGINEPHQHFEHLNEGINKILALQFLWQSLGRMQTVLINSSAMKEASVLYRFLGQWWINIYLSPKEQNKRL